MLRSMIFILLICFNFELFAQEGTYTVSLGETLSEIAYRNFPELPRLYGHGGKLEKLISLNPQLADPNFILIGQTLRLGNSSEIKVREVSQAEPTVPVEITTAPPPPAAAVEKPVEKVVATEMLQVPAVVSTQEQSKLTFNSSLGFSYFRIDAKDKLSNATSNFLSNFIPELSIGIAQPVSPELSFVSQVKYKIVNMEPLTTGQSISYADNLTSLSAGLMKNNVNGSAHFTLGSRSILFVRSTSTTSYRLDSVSIPFASLGFSRNLYSYKSTRFALGADLTYLSAAKYLSYNIKPGFGYLLKAEAISSFTKFDLGQEIYFSQDNQDSSISSQSMSEIGLRLMLKHSF